jgi:hypothetical protein
MTTEDSLRMRFVVATMLLVAGCNIFGALTQAGPRFALFSTAFTLALLGAWTAYRRDPVLTRWLTIGFVAGWLETATDAWLVAQTGTLLYPPGEPMVWESPLYMPLAWTIVLTQIGVVGGWLLQRMSLVRATLLCALLGGSSIPLYEHLAHNAGYWTYVNTPMLWNAPLYVIVAEFLLALPLVWMHRQAVARPWPFSLWLGVLAGVWMLPSVLLAWWLVGPCQGALLQFACRAT